MIATSGFGLFCFFDGFSAVTSLGSWVSIGLFSDNSAKPLPCNFVGPRYQDTKRSHRLLLAEK